MFSSAPKRTGRSFSGPRGLFLFRSIRSLKWLLFFAVVAGIVWYSACSDTAIARHGHPRPALCPYWGSLAGSGARHPVFESSTSSQPATVDSDDNVKSPVSSSGIHTRPGVFPIPEEGAKPIPREVPSLKGVRPEYLKLMESGDPTLLKFDQLLASKLFMNGLLPVTVIPFYLRAERTPDPEEVTVTTLISADRLDIFMRMVALGQGPISVCMHIDDDDSSADDVMTLLRQLRAASPNMRRDVDVHLVRDKQGRQYNLWRNVARFFARSDYFMMLDVDFSPRARPTDMLKEALSEDSPMHEAVRSGEATLVLPAFEYKSVVVEPWSADKRPLEPGVEEIFADSTVKMVPPPKGQAHAKAVDQSTDDPAAFFPTKKEDLLAQVDTGNIIMFHAKWKRGHGASDYPRWYESDKPYPVESYDVAYEPYVIAKTDGVPWCAERFWGYGANKAACLLQWYLSGTTYWVMPNGFVIHQAHGYPEKDRSSERPHNRLLFSEFIEEECMLRGREFLYAGLWDSPRAYNLRRECFKKIKNFDQVILNTFGDD